MPEPVLPSRAPQLARAAAVTPTGFSAPVAERLPGAVRRIVEALNPERIVLFGSYAYGTPTPDSDVDLLVVLDTFAPPAERYIAVSRLLRPRPFPVDILVKSPEEIRAAHEAGDPFIREIVSCGQILYVREQ